MRDTEDGPFAVYVMTVRRRNGMVEGVNAMCDQADWEAMEKARPGEQPLIRGDIRSETAAEHLARTSPPPAPRLIVASAVAPTTAASVLAALA